MSSHCENGGFSSTHFVMADEELPSEGLCVSPAVSAAVPGAVCKRSRESLPDWGFPRSISWYHSLSMLERVKGEVEVARHAVEII